MSMMNIHTLRGYTLLEMVVAVGVFSMVMLVATGSYLTLINLDRESRSTTDVMTNLSFVVESMSREIRTGTAYRCDNNQNMPNCSGVTGGTSFSFTDSRSPARRIEYFLEDGQIMVTIDDGESNVTSALTDSRVEVDSLRFFVKGVGTTGLEAEMQPQVRFIVTGTANTGEREEPFTLQGSAVGRELEVSRAHTSPCLV